MFAGIIKYTGIINKIHKSNNNCFLEISSKINFKKNEVGSSISCSGVCLTVENFKSKISKFYLTKETLNKSIFKHSKKNDLLNLEKPMKFGQPISGHFVQGHIDTTSTVKKIYYIGKSWEIDFTISKSNKKYLVQKGSITINGVSLTIAKILKNGFKIAIIPETLKLTNLIKLKKGDFVNIEFDVLGKYVENFKINEK
jgi:riboflavin synthase